jgi:hypothetical protein
MMIWIEFLSVGLLYIGGSNEHGHDPSGSENRRLSSLANNFELTLLKAREAIN